MIVEEIVEEEELVEEEEVRFSRSDRPIRSKKKMN